MLCSNNIYTHTHKNKSNKTLCLSFTICKVGPTGEAIMRTAKVSVRAVSPSASCPKFYPPSSKGYEPDLHPGVDSRTLFKMNYIIEFWRSAVQQ